MKLSVVTPAYKCSECIEELYKRCIKTFESMNIKEFEIIFINDCSPHNDWEIISNLCKIDKRVKGINFSRNFGQHYAITAGLDYVQGEWVVVMDCDLQDQPEEIPKMYKKALEGYDVVFGRRYERKDGILKKMGSNLFNLVFSYLLDKKIDNSVANFGVYNINVIKNFRKIREHNRSFPMFIRWLGFKTAYVDIEHSKRYAGKSSYTFSKLLNFAIENIVAYSNKPLKLSIKLGFFMSFFSVLYAGYLIFKYFAYGVPVEGWTSTMVSIFFVGGLIFGNLGIIGLYIGKIFDEVKNRPIYVIRDTLNIANREF